MIRLPNEIPRKNGTLYPYLTEKDLCEIKIGKSTKLKLENIGRMNDTYDSIINEMIDFVYRSDLWWEDRFD